MASIDEVLAAATLREESVDICVDGALNARWEDLGRRLADVLADTAGDPGSGAKLGDANPRAALAEEMEEVRQQMLAHSYTFRFRALPRRQYRDLLDDHPARPDKAREATFNAATFPPLLIRRCLVDPVVATDAQFEQLMDTLTEGQTAELFNAAWVANEGGSEVPKSVPASARTPGTGRS